MERLYEPVEEHYRAATIALMDGNYDTGPRHHSQPPTPSDTPRGSFAEQRDTTQEGVIGGLRIPSGITPEFLAEIQEFIDLTHWVNTPENTEVSSEPRTPSPVQTQQAGPSGTNTSPPPPEQFSQYSIRPDSPEPSDRLPVPVTPAFKTRELKLPPLSSTPSRKIRPFKASTHSPGNTVWMTTVSYEDLSDPPEPVPEDEPGVLYIHRNLTDNTLQVWLLGDEKQWTTIQLGVKTRHPTLGDRYLSVRSDGAPSWITLASWNAAQKRVNSP